MKKFIALTVLVFITSSLIGCGSQKLDVRSSVINNRCNKIAMEDSFLISGHGNLKNNKIECYFVSKKNLTLGEAERIVDSMVTFSFEEIMFAVILSESKDYSKLTNNIHGYDLRRHYNTNVVFKTFEGEKLFEYHTYKLIPFIPFWKSYK